MDTIVYSGYQYDSLQRLVGITDSNNNNRYRREITVQYSAEGNPVKFNIRYHDYNLTTGESADSLIYEEGRIVRKVAMSGSNTACIGNIYTYDAAGRLVSDSEYYYKLYSYTRYTYDNIDDVVQMETFL